MKKILAALFGLFISMSVIASPDAAMILLDDREEVTVNADGTSTTVDKCVYHILNRKGVRQMRNIQLHFNSSYGSIKVTHLALKKTDGKVVKLDPAKLSAITTESSQMESEIFDPAQKVLNVNVPGLEEGDILEVTTLEEVTKSRLPGQWSDIAVLQADFPIKRYEYTVNMPADKPLAGICVKNEVPGTLKFSQKSAGGRVIYSWVAENVPQILPEAAMPPMHTEIQRVLVSTVGSWEDISKWYDKLCAPRLAKVNGAMKEKTAELTAGKQNDTEKVMALFQFVSQQIRYTGVTDEESAPGYEPHDVSRTFNQKHGVCRDKAALLTAMLRLAGFKAYPALFMANSPKDKEVANIYFNHAIVAWETAPGQYQLMDPTFETTTEFLPGYLAGFPFLAAKPEGDTLRLAPQVKAETNLLDINTEVKKTSAVMTLKFSGTYDTMFRSVFSEWTENDIRALFASAIRSTAPGANLTGVKVMPENVRDMSKPLSVIINYTMPQFTLTGNHPVPLILPRFSSGILGTLFNGTALKKRNFSLRVMPRAIREKITVDIDPTLQYELPPKIDQTEKSLFRLKRKTAIEKDKLHEEFFIALDTMLVAPADYEKFRAVSVTAENSMDNHPIVHHQNPYSAAGAKTEVLKFSRHYTLEDKYHWGCKFHTVTKILNYAGVKENSNITIPFPAHTGKVEITGSVTDSKGKKYPITAKDIQFMDDQTTAGVPRYTKRKLAVVTLPGVDAGSIIDLTVNTPVYKRNMFHTDLVTRLSDPVKYQELIIEHPAKMELEISGIPREVQDSSTFGGKRIIRRYTVENSPKLPDEPGQPENSLWVPALQISAGNYQELIQYYTAIAQKQVDAASPEIAGLAQKTAAGKTTVMEKISAVEKYVYKHIRKVEYPLKKMFDADYTLPQVTLRDACGNSADRAILMAAMLKALNIKYEFIPVSNEKYTSLSFMQLKKFPQDIFTDLLIKTDTGDRKLYLNDAGLYADTGTLHHYNRLSLEENTLTSLHSTEAQNFQRWLYSVTLNRDLSAIVTLKYTCFGTYLERIREQFASFTAQSKKQFLEKYASKIAPQAQIIESKFENGTLTILLSIPGFAKRSGKFVSMPLPGIKELSSAMSIPGEKRQTPYFSGNYRDILIDYEISAPENFSIVVPDDFRVSIGNTFFNTEYYRNYKKHLIGFMLNQDYGIFFPDEFELLRELNRKVNHFSTENILFTVE